MKIGVNTFNFGGNARENNEEFLRETLTKIKKVDYITGIELLDRHIPGWTGKNTRERLEKGIELAKKIICDEFGFELYAIGPHLTVVGEKIDTFKLWLELANQFNIKNVRLNFGGGFPGGCKGFPKKLFYKKYIKKITAFLKKVVPIAEKNNVKLGLETHWGYSSDPQFVEKLTNNLKPAKYFGVIFDWGNFWNDEERTQMMLVAAEPHNHCHHHVKATSTRGGTMNPSDFEEFVAILVKLYREKGFSEYFSIEQSDIYENEEREGFIKVAEVLHNAISK